MVNAGASAVPNPAFCRGVLEQRENTLAQNAIELARLVDDMEGDLIGTQRASGVSALGGAGVRDLGNHQTLRMEILLRFAISTLAEQPALGQLVQTYLLPGYQEDIAAQADGMFVGELAGNMVKGGRREFPDSHLQPIMFTQRGFERARPQLAHAKGKHAYVGDHLLSSDRLRFTPTAGAPFLTTDDDGTQHVDSCHAFHLRGIAEESYYDEEPPTDPGFEDHVYRMSNALPDDMIEEEADLTPGETYSHVVAHTCKRNLSTDPITMFSRMVGKWVRSQADLERMKSESLVLTLMFIMNTVNEWSGGQEVVTSLNQRRSNHPLQSPDGFCGGLLQGMLAKTRPTLPFFLLEWRESGSDHPLNAHTGDLWEEPDVANGLVASSMADLERLISVELDGRSKAEAANGRGMSDANTHHDVERAAKSDGKLRKNKRRGLAHEVAGPDGRVSLGPHAVHAKVAVVGHHLPCYLSGELMRVTANACTAFVGLRGYLIALAVDDFNDYYDICARRPRIWNGGVVPGEYEFDTDARHVASLIVASTSSLLRRPNKSVLALHKATVSVGEAFWKTRIHQVGITRPVASTHHSIIAGAEREMGIVDVHDELGMWCVYARYMSDEEAYSFGTQPEKVAEFVRMVCDKHDLYHPLIRLGSANADNPQHAQFFGENGIEQGFTSVKLLKTADGTLLPNAGEALQRVYEAFNLMNPVNEEPVSDFNRNWIRLNVLLTSAKHRGGFVNSEGQRAQVPVASVSNVGLQQYTEKLPVRAVGEPEGPDDRRADYFKDVYANMLDSANKACSHLRVPTINEAIGDTTETLSSKANSGSGVAFKTAVLSDVLGREIPEGDVPIKNTKKHSAKLSGAYAMSDDITSSGSYKSPHVTTFRAAAMRAPRLAMMAQLLEAMYFLRMKNAFVASQKEQAYFALVEHEGMPVHDVLDILNAGLDPVEEMSQSIPTVAAWAARHGRPALASVPQINHTEMRRARKFMFGVDSAALDHHEHACAFTAACDAFETNFSREEVGDCIACEELTPKMFRTMLTPTCRSCHLAYPMPDLPARALNGAFLDMVREFETAHARPWACSCGADRESVRMGDASYGQVLSRLFQLWSGPDGKGLFNRISCDGVADQFVKWFSMKTGSYGTAQINSEVTVAMMLNSMTLSELELMVLKVWGDDGWVQMGVPLQEPMNNVLTMLRKVETNCRPANQKVDIIDGALCGTFGIGFLQKNAIGGQIVPRRLPSDSEAKKDQGGFPGDCGSQMSRAMLHAGRGGNKRGLAMRTWQILWDTSSVTFFGRSARIGLNDIRHISGFEMGGQFSGPTARAHLRARSHLLFRTEDGGPARVLEPPPPLSIDDFAAALGRDLEGRTIGITVNAKQLYDATVPERLTSEIPEGDESSWIPFGADGAGAPTSVRKNMFRDVAKKTNDLFLDRTGIPPANSLHMDEARASPLFAAHSVPRFDYDNSVTAGGLHALAEVTQAGRHTRKFAAQRLVEAKWLAERGAAGYSGHEIRRVVVPAELQFKVPGLTVTLAMNSSTTSYVMYMPTSITEEWHLTTIQGTFVEAFKQQWHPFLFSSDEGRMMLNLCGVHGGPRSGFKNKNEIYMFRPVRTPHVSSETVRSILGIPGLPEAAKKYWLMKDLGFTLAESDRAISYIPHIPLMDKLDDAVDYSSIPDYFASMATPVIKRILEIANPNLQGDLQIIQPLMRKAVFRAIQGAFVSLLYHSMLELDELEERTDPVFRFFAIPTVHLEIIR